MTADWLPKPKCGNKSRVFTYLNQLMFFAFPCISAHKAENVWLLEGCLRLSLNHCEGI